MSAPLRIAIFLGTFPVVSETFILRQITSMLDLGHHVHIYADRVDVVRDSEQTIQPEVRTHKLLEKATAVHMPVESGVWEMPVWPVAGKTWLPGAAQPQSNWARLLHAIPAICSAGSRAPRLLFSALSPSRYGFQAASLSSVYRLAHLARLAGDYDVAHAHFGPTGNSYRFVRDLWKVPLLVSFHGYDVSTVPKKSGPMVYSRLFSEADAFTANSNYMRKGLVELGCLEAKVDIVPYGIRLEDYAFNRQARSTQDPVRVLTIGRLVEKKGLEFSIRAFANVQRMHPTLRYDIVGDGPLRGSLQQLCGSLGIANHVCFHGACSGTKVRELLEQARIFVLSSVTASDGDREGTPVSLLEAQAAALPVISTEHSGIPEIVLAGSTGFLVPERDTTSLSEHLDKLVKDPNLCDEMGRAGRTFMQLNFSQQKAADSLLRIYERLKQSQQTKKR